jgi:hypothetical protein
MTTISCGYEVHRSRWRGRGSGGGHVRVPTDLVAVDDVDGGGRMDPPNRGISCSGTWTNAPDPGQSGRMR